MFFFGLPEWVCFIVTLLFVLLASEVGFRFGTRRRLKPGENPDTSAGALSGTTLGLLAFMLAFTFNGAASNHHAREDLVIEEANVIRTTYQQSLALPETYRTRVHDLLQEYVDIRVNVLKLNPKNFQKMLDRTEAIQSELWTMALVIQQKETGIPLADKFTDSLSKIFDLHVQRIHAAFQSRIPAVIWLILYLLTFITMAMMGYRIGLSGVRSTFTEVATALAFSSVLLLIVALDRPNGILKVNQKPLANVLSIIRAGK